MSAHRAFVNGGQPGFFCSLCCHFCGRIKKTRNPDKSGNCKIVSWQSWTEQEVGEKSRDLSCETNLYFAINCVTAIVLLTRGSITVTRTVLVMKCCLASEKSPGICTDWSANPVFDAHV